MAQTDGGYANPAMIPDSEEMAETNLSQDEVTLRVDRLETADTPGAVINSSDMVDVPGVGTDEDMPLPNLTRNRPFSASTISRQSAASTRSHASRSPSIFTGEVSAKSLFSYREESLKKAFEQCAKSMLSEETDGEVKGSWLLTEIDHWNHERERIVLLTEQVVIVIKYDFIKMIAIEGKKIPLLCITKLQIGDLILPAKSLMPTRDYGGVRIHYAADASITWSEWWNPWSRAMPYVTLTHHMLAYSQHENETVTYNVDEFAESVVAALDAAKKRAADPDSAGNSEDSTAGNSDPLTSILDDAPITINSYVGLQSLIFNHSRLGYYLERGGVSF